ncbi:MULTISPECIES: SMC-Scp complex subunit ScpB [unclassified Actinomyces]|uniref:SMC-Scp complex subunit ScpB n=1 Tax=unclassified Actinomyces TaxID=2609248 RepID=UPI001373F9F2|nr:MULTISPECIES: SMC-Scp complex subunit ScpB [unclassified Actinomyces]MBW3070303.1 SMC-Scp complex subunit ScpB [Actinomyces sp. 594]NDR52629.1 SMC-Scp complex subunit ScpB [Actinomyces sp. 565]QHO90868.1 SMC-Scp complex subunit ScpB [Actinomyces sp. 432]
MSAVESAAALPVPVPEEELRAAVEAVLAVADEPVTVVALAQALDRDEQLIEAVLESLAAEYAGEKPGPDGGTRARGFVLRRAAGGWRLASAPRFSELVERFVIGGATARLSQAALETLAVIAYRQPVTRGRIAAVRGVNVDGVVRTLHARGLIEEAGTEPSGAILYRTTGEFLEYLGLDSLADLPPLAPYLPDSSALGDIEDEITGRMLP